MRDSVTVVGGGIVGIACAHYLSQAGMQVKVIDQSAIGSGCSQANLGMICPSHILPLAEPGAWKEGLLSLFDAAAPFRIKPQFDLALLYWMMRFARRCTSQSLQESAKSLHSILELSAHEYRVLFSQGELQGEWKENGLLYAFQSDSALNEFSQTTKAVSDQFDIPIHRLDSKALMRMEPSLRSGLAGGYYYPGDGSVRPEVLIASWKAILEKSGVAFVENSELLGIEFANKKISKLITSQGEVISDHVVFATGAWSKKLSSLLKCKIPVEPGKGYSLTLPKGMNAAAHPILFPEKRVGATPFEGGFRLGSMMEFAGFDISIPTSRMEQLFAAAQTFLADPPDSEDAQPWYGWRPMTWDSLPIVGRLPGLSNALIATGHNMLGVSLAPATGKLITQVIREEPTQIPIDVFSLERF